MMSTSPSQHKSLWLSGAAHLPNSSEYEISSGLRLVMHARSIPTRTIHNKRLCFALLPLATILSTYASENTAEDYQTPDSYKMDKVIVTAARTAQTVDQTLAAVSVITREEIESSQATNIAELLEMLPGVQIASTGGPGSTTSLFVRGTNTAQSLVLINGQRIGSATSGSSPLQYIDPNQIERIEVVRGPKASLYGADAIGGVVNIITRTGTKDLHTSIKAGYGSRNSHVASANIGAGNGTTNYYLGVSRFATDGYDRTIDVKDDNDGYDNNTVNLSLNHAFTDKFSSGLSFYHSEGTTDYDSSGYDPQYNFEILSFSTSSIYRITNKWQASLNLSYTEDDSEAVKTDYPNEYKTTRHLASWQNDILVTDNTQITTGFDYYEDKVESSVAYGETSRDNKSVFAQSQTAFTSSDLQLAIRWDDNERYGKKTTGNVAYGYDLPANIRIIASYGMAFKAPTFNDLYYPNSGNPNLKPEESKNFELELRGKLLSGHWSVAIYENTIDNLISTQKDKFSGQIVSIDKAKIRGIEFSGQYDFDVLIKGSLTLLDPKEIRKNAPDLILIRRSRQTLALDISKKMGAFALGTDLLAKSRFVDTNWPDRINMPGFATVSLRAAWQASPDIKLETRIDNLLNKKYQTTFNYNEPSRGLLASVTWTPSI